MFNGDFSCNNLRKISNTIKATIAKDKVVFQYTVIFLCTDKYFGFTNTVLFLEIKLKFGYMFLFD